MSQQKCVKTVIKIFRENPEISCNCAVHYIRDNPEIQCPCPDCGDCDCSESDNISIDNISDDTFYSFDALTLSSKSKFKRFLEICRNFSVVIFKSWKFWYILLISIIIIGLVLHFGVLASTSSVDIANNETVVTPNDETVVTPNNQNNETQITSTTESVNTEVGNSTIVNENTTIVIDYSTSSTTGVWNPIAN